MEKVKVLGMAGSLRKMSYNRALLRAAAELAPADVEIEAFDLAGFPLYNNDLEAVLPDIVKAFKSKVKAADALLFATPEYNYSVPGVLKNAIDWASRPPSDNSFDGKPAAIMGASTGTFGTSRAQYHLRQTFVGLNMRPINRPEVMVNFAKEKFDAEGRLIDPKARELVGKLIANLDSAARKG
jgi:chromate reductase, NAD(P)H dehydrogenase (quinone)